MLAHAGLTFGQAIAGIMAQSKGRAIGIYEAHGKDDAAAQAQHKREADAGVERVDVFGMKVPSTCLLSLLMCCKKKKSYSMLGRQLRMEVCPLGFPQCTLHAACTLCHAVSVSRLPAQACGAHLHPSYAPPF
jgi:hypothetical protein